MEKISILKAVVSFGVSLGVGTIVGNAVKFTTPADISKISKVLIGIGSMALAGMAGEKVSAYTEETIDETVGKMKEFISEVEK